MHYKIKPLQGFRALGFIMIFIWHCGFGYSGAYAVSLFVMLSGFVMMYKKSPGGGTNSLVGNIKNAIKRIKRLYPLHILMLLFSLLYSYLNGSIEYNYGLLIKIITNIFLVQSWIPRVEFYFSMNGVSWYLSTTLFLYILFPYVASFVERIKNRVNIHALIIVTYALMVSAGYISGLIFQNVEIVQWITYICPLFRCIDFMIGCFIAELIKNSKFVKSKKITFLLELAFMFFTIGSIILYYLFSKVMLVAWIRYSIINTPAIIVGLILFGSQIGGLSRLFSSRVLVWLGDYSGYYFLIHQLAIWYTSSILKRIGVQHWLFMPIALLITILAGVVYKHLIDYFSSRKYRKQ